MREDFIPALRKYFKDHGLVEARDGVESFQGPFMVGFDAHLMKSNPIFLFCLHPHMVHQLGLDQRLQVLFCIFARVQKYESRGEAERSFGSGRGDDLL
jgi:hypothetical protein